MADNNKNPKSVEFNRSVKDSQNFIARLSGAAKKNDAGASKPTQKLEGSLGKAPVRDSDKSRGTKGPGAGKSTRLQDKTPAPKKADKEPRSSLVSKLNQKPVNAKPDEKATGRNTTPKKLDDK